MSNDTAWDAYREQLTLNKQERLLGTVSTPSHLRTITKLTESVSTFPSGEYSDDTIIWLKLPHQHPTTS